MRIRRFDLLFLLLCALVIASALTACAAPAPQAAQQASATANEQAPAPTGAPAQSRPDLRSLHPRTGGPLPPQVSSSPVKIDRSCASDADCTIKDVGNCCGAAPACVNVDSATDPKGVQAECARKGMASICGFRPIDHCQCVQGECTAATTSTEAQ